MNTGALTHLKDKEKETKELGWASVSPDGKTVVYAKDLNLYRMSREDYEKLKKDDKDTTVTDIQITTDGVMDFGYGLGYSYLNTDTIVDGKRKGVWGVWSPDSRYFVTELTDNRAVKPLWVINAVAEPRPTLETYSIRCRARWKPRGAPLSLRHDRQLAQGDQHLALQKTRPSRWPDALMSRSSARCTMCPLSGWATTAGFLSPDRAAISTASTSAPTP